MKKSKIKKIIRTISVSENVFWRFKGKVGKKGKFVSNEVEDFMRGY